MCPKYNNQHRTAPENTLPVMKIQRTYFPAESLRKISSKINFGGKDLNGYNYRKRHGQLGISTSLLALRYYWKQRNEKQQYVQHRRTQIFIDLFTERFSDYDRMLRVTAYCRRFIENCRRNPTNSPSTYITTKEKNAAEATLIRLVQQQEFAEEWKQLQKSQHVTPKSLAYVGFTHSSPMIS